MLFPAAISVNGNVVVNEFLERHVSDKIKLQVTTSTATSTITSQQTLPESSGTTTSGTEQDPAISHETAQKLI